MGELRVIETKAEKSAPEAGTPDNKALLAATGDKKAKNAQETCPLESEATQNTTLYRKSSRLLRTQTHATEPQTNLTNREKGGYLPNTAQALNPTSIQDG